MKRKYLSKLNFQTKFDRANVNKGENKKFENELKHAIVELKKARNVKLLELYKRESD